MEPKNQNIRKHEEDEDDWGIEKSPEKGNGKMGYYDCETGT